MSQESSSSDSGEGEGRLVVRSRPGPHLWSPQEGAETRDLMNHVFPGPSRDTTKRHVVDASAAILGSSLSPCQPSGSETGLVIGYVQSGKTLSFTTVLALARDNGYRIVIVLTGISMPLFDQSKGRIRRDLRLDAQRERKWCMFSNPRSASDQRTLRDILADWRDSSVPHEQKMTALITVMKNHRHLADLRDVLSSLDLSASPVLIVDDEADQASLNTLVRQGQQSTTYARIAETRQVIPHHTFLQYTATPQAPLLISLIDALSPSFVRILEPGAGYTGGHTFFVEQLDMLVREIPQQDLVADDSDRATPPDSLLEALRVYLVGVAAGLVAGSPTGNRSMLVHPSHKTVRHSIYYNWIARLRTQWEALLARAGTAAAAELLEDFREAYRNLRASDQGLPDFDVVKLQLPRAIRMTRVEEVNATRGRTPTIPWSDFYSWIIVAGQAVDRGFTVEGLTVTYMPRPLGVGNADTLQQRGRFFGYKRGYLGLCRVYLPLPVIDAFRSYVQHEENVRTQLQEYQLPGRSLREWKRAFILSPSLRPTRRNVLEKDYSQGLYSDDWFLPWYPLGTAVSCSDNRRLGSEYLARLPLVPNEGHSDRRPIQRHSVARHVPLGEVLNELLVPFVFSSPSDSTAFVGLLLQLERAVERNPHEVCTVYRMSPGEQRSRTVDADGKITYLFQGAFPVEKAKRGSVYPGDARVHEVDDVTVQVHSLRLSGPGCPSGVDDVFALAVWVPARLGAGWLVQDED